jgi:type IV secretion system protein TrbG
VRWIVGDTTSASGAAQRVHVLVKPVRANLKTNLVIATSRRIYLIELTATAETWMASVSWDYPRDRLTALKNQAQRAEAAAPVADGIALDRLSFRYEITGDTPSWRPLRAFDDGERVYIQFPAGIAQGELPPVFVVGTSGTAELVNYRYRAPYYIVDRLFGAAELRLGGNKAQVVRISRTDGIKRGGHS